MPIKPKYAPVFLKDDLKKGTTGRISWILASLSMIFLLGLLTVYLLMIRPGSGHVSCYDFGCYDSHRAELYGRIPEDNISIPRLEGLGSGSKAPGSFKLVCYYNFPTDENSDELQVKDLDPNLCTHVNAGFADIENNSIVLSESNLRSLREIVELKHVNKNLKVLLSIGGSGAGGFSSMVLNHTTRKIFIQSVLSYVKSYKIDGIDLDWEFPNEVGVKTRERTHFSQLIYEIRKEIDRQRKHKFLLTLAVAAPYFVALNSYDIGFISDYVDYVNIMTYDFHFYTKLTPFTGINSPLYSLPHDIGIFGTLSLNYSANFWLSQGMSREKIVIGLPTYGHTYKLINTRNNGISAPAIGFGDTGSNGFLDYGQACEFMEQNGVVPNFDEVSKSPYATFSHEWISFDDTKSLTYKAEYIKSNSFGGAMVYCLNSDDYRNVCKAPFYGNRTKFPLVQAIRDVLVNPKY